MSAVLRRPLASVALAAAIAVCLSACGSSGSPAAASAGVPGAGGGGSSSARYQARLKAARCFRAHGVNVPDPSANGGPPTGGGGGGGGGAGGGDGGRIGQLLRTPAGQAALKACASDLRGAFGLATLTPAQRQQFRQDAVKFAECMRAHNVDIPDPSSNGAGGFGIFRSIAPSERNSPAFQSAFQICSSNLPNRGRFSGRGGPGGATANVGGPGA